MVKDDRRLTAREAAETQISTDCKADSGRKFWHEESMSEDGAQEPH
jgi:hypothetical protein